MIKILLFIGFLSWFPVIHPILRDFGKGDERGIS